MYPTQTNVPDILTNVPNTDKSTSNIQTDIVPHALLPLGGKGVGVGVLLAQVGVVHEGHLLGPGPHVAV